MQAEREIYTPIGKMTLCENAEGLWRVCFGGNGGRRDQTSLLLQAEEEMEEYFAGRRRSFSVPLSMQGTPFQLHVWNALLEIPYGETAGYGQIAQRIGHAKAARAVGAANHVNPLPIFVPCHRVVGANGRLVGYDGGLAIKEFLLELERKHAQI